MVSTKEEKRIKQEEELATDPFAGAGPNKIHVPRHLRYPMKNNMEEKSEDEGTSDPKRCRTRGKGDAARTWVFSNKLEAYTTPCLPIRDCGDGNTSRGASDGIRAS